MCLIVCCGVNFNKLTRNTASSWNVSIRTCPLLKFIKFFSILFVTNKYSAHLLSERLTFVCRHCKPICIWCSICAPCTAVTWRMASYNMFVSQELILNYTDTNTSETFTRLELSVAGSQSGHSSAHSVVPSFNCRGFYCFRFWDAAERYQQQILGGGEKKPKKGN